MNPTMTCSILALAIGLAAAPLLAADGVLIVEQTTTGGATRTNQIQIEKTRMRAESTDPSGAQRIIVFDGTAQVIRMIDPAKKTYTELTKAEVDRLGSQMNDMMAKMQEQMKGMPPGMREKMEAMMRGRGMPGAAAAAKTEYRKTGTGKVAKWTCDQYDGLVNNQKTSEVCTVDPKALGFTAADFEVTKQLAEFFRQLMPQNAEQMFSIGANDPQGFSGVPVRRVYSIGPNQTVSELSEVSRQTFADSLFAVPTGYQKQTFSMPGQ
ncbi:MAG TPA: hypothetical protein VM818_06990 [Vicinamibacterales bacterium]|nr:hypothetical protein [Vicinamibacterales bacterium]